MHSAPSRFLAALGMLGFAEQALAQVLWQRAVYLPPLSAPLVYDGARDRFVVLAADGLGPAATWERDRALGWLRRTPPGAAPTFQAHGMAFDSARSVTVLLQGSYGLGPLSETWEWDGATWGIVNPTVQPPARSGHAMVFDASSGRVVMFGGISVRANYLPLGDTWEYDGVTWTQQAVGGPSPRSSSGLVFDAARGEVLLFGGWDGQATLADAWVWANGTWSARPGGPSARRDPGLAFDVGRGRVVMFGGSPSYGSHLDDTWEWDGAQWTSVAATPRPSARRAAGLASDPVGGGVLLAGGDDGTGGVADTWRFDGVAWTRLDDVPQPAPRHSHAVAFDEVRGELLVFGGIGVDIFDDLWRWDGAQWSRATTPGPSPRTRAVMAYDAARAEAVLFGGELPGFTDQTWAWDGNAWSQRFPATAPSPRVLHAMAYDRQRARVVLFGGTGGTFLGDTWEWDGAAWLLRPGPAPSARHGHAMAYDDARGVTVLYGGTGPGFPFGTILSDTWEWDGATWTQRLPASSPGPRREFAMAYDGARGRVVVFGDPQSDETWEWDGTDWLQRQPSEAPAPRARTGLVYDPWRERTWLVGGQSVGPNLFDVWQYGPIESAQVTAFGTACAGSQGLPAITAGARPWLGDVVPLGLENGPASAPALVWLGGSTTQFGALPLPASLGAIGMPGCTLWTGIDLAVPTAADASGRASVPLVVPNAPPLLGAELHAQGAFFDPPANSFGAAVSAAITLHVGGR